MRTKRNNSFKLRVSIPIQLLFGFFVLVASQSITNRNPTQNQIAPRIIGGTNAPKNSYPWFVNLSGSCGGVLISPKYVLTSAHCTSFVQKQKIDIGFYCIYLDNCSQRKEYIGIKKKYIHPNYEWGSTSPNHDIMLIELEQKSTIPFAPIDAIGLSSNYQAGKELQVIGMGITDIKTQHLPVKLQHATVEFVPQTKCSTLFDELSRDITSNMMCAGNTGKDACQGDSGGALWDHENNVVVGLTSWGYKCAHETYPGVYSRIGTQMDFISGVVCNGEDKDMSFCNGFPTQSPTEKIPCEGLELEVDLQTDFFPFETWYEVRDIYSGAQIMAVQGLTEIYHSYQEGKCLPLDSCYQFSIYDDEGDGIAHLDNSYDVKVNGVDLSSTQKFDKSHESILFGECSECNPVLINLKIRTDDRAGETTWSITDSVSGLRIWDGGYLRTYHDNTEYDFGLNICQGCYTFRIEDSFGDGMVGDAGYQLSVNGDEFIGGSFSFSDSFQFGNCTSSCKSDEISVDLDVDIWGKGMELSWQIMEEKSLDVVASSSHGYSGSRTTCLPKLSDDECYVFRSITSGNSVDKFPDFEYSVLVDGKFLVRNDSSQGGNYKFGCRGALFQSSNENNSARRSLLQFGHYCTLFLITMQLFF